MNKKYLTNYSNGRSYYNPNAFKKRARGYGGNTGAWKYKLASVFLFMKGFFMLIGRLIMLAIAYPIAAVAIIATISCVCLKVVGDIKFNSTAGQNKILKQQRDQFLLGENSDGTKTTNVSEAIRLHLEALNKELEKDFSKGGLITLYTDRMYKVPKNAKEEDIVPPTYEEKPELFVKVMYQHPTKIKGTINLSTHILPAFTYSLDRKLCERVIAGNSIYINIPDAAISAVGFEDERGGSEAKDSFGATISQIFNQKEEEESKAHDGMESAIKTQLDKAAQERLLDPEVMEEVRKAAVAELYETLGSFVDTSHIIIKANGAQLKDELAIINEQNAKNANK